MSELLNPESDDYTSNLEKHIHDHAIMALRVHEVRLQTANSSLKDVNNQLSQATVDVQKSKDDLNELKESQIKLNEQYKQLLEELKSNSEQQAAAQQAVDEASTKCQSFATQLDSIRSANQHEIDVVTNLLNHFSSFLTEEEVQQNYPALYDVFMEVAGESALT